MCAARGGGGAGARAGPASQGPRADPRGLLRRARWEQGWPRPTGLGVCQVVVPQGHLAVKFWASGRGAARASLRCPFLLSGCFSDSVCRPGGRWQSWVRGWRGSGAESWHPSSFKAWLAPPAGGWARTIAATATGPLPLGHMAGELVPGQRLVVWAPWGRPGHAVRAHLELLSFQEDVCVALKEKLCPELRRSQNSGLSRHHGGVPRALACHGSRSFSSPRAASGALAHVLLTCRGSLILVRGSGLGG